MQKMKVFVKKLENFRGDLPTYETKHASGFDFRAQLATPLTLKPGERALISTGLAVEIPLGFEIQVRPRSGWATKKGITVVNTPGTVDADYRGEVKIGLINLGSEALEIQDQDRVAQGVLCPVVQAQFEETSELSATYRGAGGFGSTGMRVEGNS
jgi:dUTP pyrophosphatase